MKKSSITILTIIGVIILAYFLINNSFSKKDSQTSKEIAKCIGENSLLYVQLGCTHCENQKKMFGNNYQYLKVIDCFYKQKECSDKNIKVTPTWIINNKEYLGVQNIDKLKELTKC